MRFRVSLQHSTVRWVDNRAAEQTANRYRLQAHATLESRSGVNLAPSMFTKPSGLTVPSARFQRSGFTELGRKRLTNRPIRMDPRESGRGRGLLSLRLPLREGAAAIGCGLGPTGYPTI